MKPHELLGLDKPDGPYCLFCRSQCIITESSGGNFPGVTRPTFSDRYTCLDCNESFVVHHIDEDEPYAFDFSCGPLLVVCHYDTDMLVLRRLDGITTDVSEDNPVGIPYFDFNFDDKLGLINKLKTYMIFA